jgi:hypothetical protein
VVLPDYQGLGIGVRFINEVARIVCKDGLKLNLTTTTPALVGALKKASEWQLFRKGVVGAGNLKRLGTIISSVANKGSQMRPTFSFNYRNITKQANSMAGQSCQRPTRD